MSDFAIKWGQEEVITATGPATDAEVKAIMDEIKRQALIATLNEVVIEAKGRHEVVVKVANGINATSSGYAAVNYCTDPVYDSEKGYYISTLMIAKSSTALRKYLKNLK